jgi:hypothetical protein
MRSIFRKIVDPSSMEEEKSCYMKYLNMMRHISDEELWFKEYEKLCDQYQHELELRERKFNTQKVYNLEEDINQLLGMDLLRNSDIESEFSNDSFQAEAAVSQNNSSVVTSQVVSFVDNVTGTVVEFPSVADPSFFDDYTARAELGEYLSRPTLIYSQDWTEGSGFNSIFDPWNLFFSNVNISRKLADYSLLNCRLHIKVMINASPFYYGAAIFTYTPLQNWCSDTITEVGADVGYRVPLSQRPHLWLYPQNSQGGEMILPFFYYKDWLRVNSDTDFTNMGNIRIQSYTDLLNANSVAGTGCSIQVYAWAEDVKLTAPTVADPLQADEYTANGPISKPASAIAAAAGLLERVPLIGPYMTATKQISGGVGNLASLFGFSNPPVIDPVAAYKTLPFHGAANADLSEPTAKLTIESKNELSVDPRIVGLDGTDQMDISYLVGKESFLHQFSWSAADLDDSVLYHYNITPAQMVVEATSYVQSTPMGHIQELFRYWRGDIIFRFRIICSQYHRGRLAFVWDPEGNIMTIENSNTAYTRIVDITQEQDVEIRVPYAQAYPWLKTKAAGNYRGSYIRDATTDNGNLSVWVLTKQTSPVASADIQVLTFVKGAENLEFAAPLTVPQSYTFFIAQPEELLLDSIEEEKSEEPLQSETVLEHDDEEAIADTSGIMSARYLVNHGEKISSLRQLLRRICFHRSETAGNVTTRYAFYNSNFARKPIFFGPDPNGIGTTAALSTFNYTATTYYNYLAPMFVGQRGAHEWFIHTHSGATQTHYQALDRLPTTNIATNYRVISGVATGLSLNVMRNELRNNTAKLSSGGALLDNQIQSGMTISAPNYSFARMQNTAPKYAVLGLAEDGSNIDNLFHQLEYGNLGYSGDSGNAIDFKYYHRIGTDFSLLFFLNVPTKQIIATPTPA